MIEKTIVDFVVSEMNNCFRESDGCFSNTRDVFAARLQSFILETAFTKRISGRAPEQRGNGLKFVSEAIQQNSWHLYFQSGSGSCSINKNGIEFMESSVSVPGCLAIIDFSGEQ